MCFLLAVGGAHAEPVGHVAALQVAALGFEVGEDGHTSHLATEPASLADVAAPCNRIAFVDGVVHHLHQFVDGKVPGLAPAPVVLHFDDELLIEGMVRERGQVDVVVHVEARRFGKAHGRVLLAIVGELGGRHAKVGIVNASQALLPQRIAVLVHLDFAALDDTSYIRVGDG